MLTAASSYLEQQLVFGDPLHGFDEGRGDGVGQAVSPLDLLHVTNIVFNFMKLEISR